MTQGTKRLTEELHRLEALPLRDILDQMAKTGSPTVVCAFNGTQDKPVAAVALITGPDTADRIEALEKPNRVAVPYQNRVHAWMLECFGQKIASDITERNHRFLEEALELVQSTGCTSTEAHRLVDYVFGRAVGDPPQEVGGVRVTLAALCLAAGIDGEAAAETELARIVQPETIERIRAKQRRKPAVGPLPGVYPERDPACSTSPSGKPDEWWRDPVNFGPDPGGWDQLCQNVAAMRRDAQRYQWLRDPDNFGPDEGEGPSGWDQLCELAGDDFDAFVDGRMDQDHKVESSDVPE
jgi:hypothetical protein